MITKETVKDLLLGIPDICPNGHTLLNLADHVQMCDKCGNELVIECPTCKRQPGRGDDYQWNALFFIQRQWMVDEAFKAHTKGQVN